MAKVTRVTLKTYFEAGDKPTELQYIDLIDSMMNLQDCDTQTVCGPISASAFYANGIVLGGGSLSGTITTAVQNNITTATQLVTIGTVTTGNVTAILPDGIYSSSQQPFTSITASADISASGTGSFGFFNPVNISASGFISASSFAGDGAGLTNITADNITQPFYNVTSSNNISASGILYASSANFADGNISNVGTIGADMLYADGSQIQIGANAVVENNIYLKGPVTASSHISASGNIIGATISASSNISAGFDINAGRDIMAGRNLGVIGTIINNGLTNFGNSTDDTHTFTGDITASRHISASGTVTALSMSADGSNLTNVPSAEGGTVKVFCALPLYILTQPFYNITASKNISASENIYGKTGSFVGGIISQGHIHVTASKPRIWVRATSGAPSLQLISTGSSIAGVVAFQEGDDHPSSNKWISEFRLVSSTPSTGKPFELQEVQKAGSKVKIVRIYSGSAQNTLVITGSRIGVGTTDPQKEITVVGDISASGTVYAEHFHSSDDAVISDDLTVGDNITLGGTLSGSSFAEVHSLGGRLELKHGNEAAPNVMIGKNAGKVYVGSNSTFIGTFSGVASTGGFYNTAVGDHTLYQNTVGKQNTALGAYALHANTTGTGSTAVGEHAGSTNTTGNFNIFLGHGSGTTTAHTRNKKLYISSGSNPTIFGDLHQNKVGINTTGSGGTLTSYLNVVGDISATGALGNITASKNISASGLLYASSSVGNYANVIVHDTSSGRLYTTASADLFVTTAQTASYVLATNIDQPFADITMSGNFSASKTTGAHFMGGRLNLRDAVGNIFIGQDAGQNATGAESTFIGRFAGKDALAGVRNTVVGAYSFYNNTKGKENTAIGAYSLYQNQTGTGSIAIGQGAGQNNTTGNYNMYLGFGADVPNTGFWRTYDKRLYLGSGSSPVIFGQLDTKKIGINTTGSKTAVLPNYLTVAGDIWASGSLGNITASNDISASSQVIAETGSFEALTSPLSTSKLKVLSKTIFEQSITASKAISGSDINAVHVLGGRLEMIGGNSTAPNVIIGKHAGRVYNGANSTFVGTFAGVSSSAGFYNTAIGDHTLYFNTVGKYNTALGAYALTTNTVGTGSTGVGSHAGLYNTTGDYNIFLGYHAGGAPQATWGTLNKKLWIASGSNPTIFGDLDAKKVGIGTSGSTGVLPSTLTVEGDIKNTNISMSGHFSASKVNAVHYMGGRLELTGDNVTAPNVKIGKHAGMVYAGSNSTFIGSFAGVASTGGFYNTAIGDHSLYVNTTGKNLTALGAYSLYQNTTGTGSTALGNYAGQNNTTGDYNIYLGYGSDVPNTGFWRTRNKKLYIGSGSNPTIFGNIDTGKVGINTTGSKVSILPSYLTVAGDVWASGSLGNITASKNISASGTGSFGRLLSHTIGGLSPINLTDSIIVSGNITASGNISASGTIVSENINLNGALTASGIISSSGTIYAAAFVADGGVNMDTDITASGHISSSTGASNLLNFNSGSFTFISSSGNIYGSTIYANRFESSGSGTSIDIIDNLDITGEVTASGNISSSKTITGLSGSFGYISSSGTITASSFYGDGSNLTGLVISAGTNINTANITASGNISGSSTTTLTIGGDATVHDLIVRQITASSNISSSYTVFARTGSFTVQTNINSQTNVTASGNISASGDIIGKKLNISTEITASGIISASYISASNGQFGTNVYINGTDGHITASGDVKATGQITGSHVFAVSQISSSVGKFTDVYGTVQQAAQPNITSIGTLLALNNNGNTILGNNALDTHTITGKTTFTGPITASIISASGTIYASKFESAGAASQDIIFNDNLIITGSITASGGISASSIVVDSMEVTGANTFTNWGNFRNRFPTNDRNFQVSTNPYAAGGFREGMTVPTPAKTGSAPHLHFMLSGSGQVGVGLLNPEHTLHVSESSENFKALQVEGQSQFNGFVGAMGLGNATTISVDTKVPAGGYNVLLYTSNLNSSAAYGLVLT